MRFSNTFCRARVKSASGTVSMNIQLSATAGTISNHRNVVFLPGRLYVIYQPSNSCPFPRKTCGVLKQQFLSILTVRRQRFLFLLAAIVVTECDRVVVADFDAGEHAAVAVIRECVGVGLTGKHAGSVPHVAAS